MSLAAGTRLGPYEITSAIGEVYKPRDTRLNGDVAIKISAEAFTERFDREAKRFPRSTIPASAHCTTSVRTTS